MSDEIECFHDGDVRVDILTGERWCEECSRKIWSIPRRSSLARCPDCDAEL